MVANADDLRYFYGEFIGVTQQITLNNGSPTPVDLTAEKGRFALRVLDYAGVDVWVRQGKANVVAAAAAPAMRFIAHTDPAELNKPLITFMVKDGNQHLSFFATGGAPVIQLTKVSSNTGLT